ncbi:hypothetical protein IFM89_005681 [Coptis chinensis]|uniref:Uncharacterized protein n=1 Tax=Coptis chinensis TaxID=261450 RepID=A0A835GUI4_9MAGN|nr:hypothetical protein IFM89_005681 [Coptis chinensis]
MPTRHLPPTAPLPAEDMAGEKRPLTEAEPPLSSRHYHPPSRSNPVLQLKHWWQQGVKMIWGHSNSITSLAFSADGKLLASGSFDGLVQVWDAYSGSPKCTLAGPSDGVEVKSQRIYWMFKVVIQRIDPSTEEILITAGHRRGDVEGSLFVVKRYEE